MNETDGMTASTPDRPDLTRDQFTNDESYYLATGRMTALTPQQYRAICETCGWRASKPDTKRSTAWVRLLMQHRNALHPECGEIATEVFA